MPSTKVTYFNVRGLAETIRILLKYGNVEFEDVRLEHSEWPTMKSSAPFGQLPLYDEDGKVVNQSLAISRYLAKKFGLTGADDWEDLEIDAIVDTVNDFRLKAAPIFMENDPDRKESIKQTFLAETVPYYLERFEKIADQNDGHMAIKKFTWADIHLLVATDLINCLVGEDVTEKYPNIQAVRKTVMEVPAIKEWIESRPQTDL